MYSCWIGKAAGTRDRTAGTRGEVAGFRTDTARTREKVTGSRTDTAGTREEATGSRAELLEPELTLLDPPWKFKGKQWIVDVDDSKYKICS